MTNDEGCKPEGAPERSPKAGEGAPSGVDGDNPKRFSVQRSGSPRREGGRRLCAGGYGPPIARPNRRRSDQVMGAVALCWRSGEPPPGLTGEGRERLARSASGRTETKPHDGTIVTPNRQAARKLPGDRRSSSREQRTVTRQLVWTRCMGPNSPHAGQRDPLGAERRRASPSIEQKFGCPSPPRRSGPVPAFATLKAMGWPHRDVVQPILFYLASLRVRM
jgi:hypothetical protein